MEAEGSLLCSQQLVIFPYPESCETSLYPHFQCLEGPFQDYSLVYIQSSK